MDVSEDLIKRFLENRCSKEEATLVYEYLLNNKELLDKWLPEEEWESFEGSIKLNSTQSNSWFEQIEERKDKGRLYNISLKWIPVAAAVLVGIISFVAAYRFLQSSPRKSIANIVRQQIPATKEKTFRNNSQKTIPHTLNDGSVVELHANSTVVCNQPFDSTVRSITLHGEALFRVAKDKVRPFTVFTKGFSTTALGTVFQIKAYDSSSTSTVKLIEGKVVLKNLRNPEKQMYLKPGDEYNFSYKDNKFRSITAKTPIPVKTAAPIHVDGSITETTTEISFSNTPLPDVMKKISGVYNIRIDTDGAQLEGRKFTGSFLKKQSADDVLTTIAGLNNYRIIQEGSVYRLTIQ